MSMLNVFDGDAYGTASLSASINKLPYRPRLLGEMNIFQMKSLTDDTAKVEEKHGKLGVIQTAARGSMPNVRSRPAQQTRAFKVPNCPQNSEIMADDIQSVRAFGSETQTETVAAVVNDHLMQHAGDHETTFEWHRMGAIKGQVLDADGSVIVDLFSAFGQTQDTITMNFGTDDVSLKATQILRLMDIALGDTMYSGVSVFCGDNFYDNLITDPTVKASYANWNASAIDFEDRVHNPFTFGGIQWHNYRGRIGGTNWVDDDQAHCVARGTPDTFLHHMAPAAFVETVNTRGQRMYAKQRRLDFDVGIQVHSVSCPFIICTRPKSLILLQG